MEMKRVIAVAIVCMCIIGFSCCRALALSSDPDLVPDDSSKTRAYVEVVDKYSRKASTGRSCARKYRAVVEIDGEEIDVNLPSKVYDEVEIGDEIKVTVVSRDDKIMYAKYRGSRKADADCDDYDEDDYYDEDDDDDEILKREIIKRETVRRRHSRYE